MVWVFFNPAFVLRLKTRIPPSIHFVPTSFISSDPSSFPSNIVSFLLPTPVFVHQNNRDLVPFSALSFIFSPALFEQMPLLRSMDTNKIQTRHVPPVQKLLKSRIQGHGDTTFFLLVCV